MRENFEKDICYLKEMFIDMGKQAWQVTKLAMESLEEQDVTKAYQAIKLDDVVDQLDHDIESKCLSLIALQQPIAKDLRALGTLIKIITDMERIGDYGVNIAKITLAMDKENLSIPLNEIQIMAESIKDMLHKTMESFMKEDVQLARSVAEMDDIVDYQFKKIIDDIVSYISKNPNVSKEATNLMFVARHLERIADHTTNICERIIYMVTGDLIEIN